MRIDFSSLGVVEKFDPKQLRDKRGRWTETGLSGDVVRGYEVGRVVGKLFPIDEIEGMPSVPIRGMHRYANDSYAVNEFLRTGGLDRKERPRRYSREEETADLLDELFELVYPLKNDIEVLRGVTDSSFIPEDGSGTRFRDRAFVSTTYDPLITDAFSFTRDANKMSATIKIQVPRGTKVLPVFQQGEDYAEPAGEAEILLNRNTVFEIVSDRFGADKRGKLERKITVKVVTE